MASASGTPVPAIARLVAAHEDSVRDDQLWGVMRRRRGGDHTLAAFQSIRATRPDGSPIYISCDNLSANTTPASASGPLVTRSSCT